MPSLRPRTRFALLALALYGLSGTAHAARSPSLARQPFAFDATSSEVDYKTHTGTFEHIKISQGQITVRAERAQATGLGGPSKNSQWTLVGNVRIHAPPHGNLTANQAVVDVSDSRIIRVTVTGNPAEFTQQGMAPGKIAQGHADRIVYDVNAGTVLLSTDAWLSDGRNQISGPLVRYNILKDRIEATSHGPGERVHITIAPQTAPAKGTKAPGAAPPAHRAGGPTGTKAATRQGKPPPTQTQTQRRSAPPGTAPHRTGRSS